MATDTILSKTELEDLFYDLTVSIMNSSPDFDVRHSWPTNGAPAFEVDDNLVFLSFFDIPSPVTQQRETKYTQEGSPQAGNMQTTYTRTLKVVWKFYGPDSWDNARLLMDRIFYQEYHDELSAQNLFMIPDFNPPKQAPELWEGLWYKRCDLIINFNEGVSINREVSAIETVAIGIHNYEGIVATVNIEDEE